jgi:hypothetical protein
MPRHPKGRKRRPDVIGNAIHVARIATRDIEETRAADGKDPAAVALGRKGGQARAAKMSKKERSAVAKKGAKARWG